MMVGIDLVDLSDPLLKPRDERALRLISHPADHFPDHPLRFWHLWTAKEAVFKAYREIIPFDPKKIDITISQEGNHLTFQSNNLRGSIFQEQSVIYAVAYSEDRPYHHQILKRKTSSPSAEVRTMLIQYIKLNYDEETIISADEKGLPVLSHQWLPISFTHHHDYLGFMLPTPQ
ncbi:4'-phosphopantetheinyl transferase family protein [Marinoscillum sp.]|uniref:4'-phosphopantetheinyl transferase family protein n=1 Tax=Marinoscillum sp. TaxID=2024838 RepID=UPI003BAC41F6